MHDMTLRNSSVEMIFRRRVIRPDSGHEQCFQEFLAETWKLFLKVYVRHPWCGKN